MVELRDGDYMKYLIGYIERNSNKGYNLDQIRLMLLNQNYSRAAVDRAIRIYETNKPAPVPEVREEPKPEVIPEIVEEKRGFFARLFGLGKKKE